MSSEEVDRQLRQAEEAARRGQERHGAAAQQYGRIVELLGHTRPYWMNAANAQTIDPNFCPIVQSGMANVAAIAVTIGATVDDAERGFRGIDRVWKGVVTFAGTTIATNDFHPVTDVFLRIDSVILDPQEDIATLGERLEKIDPSLRATCDEVFQAVYGTTADPVRAAAFMTRQLWDHFFAKLAPSDEEVRKSAFWREKSGMEKPMAVSREERVRCAIERNIARDADKVLLHGSVDSMCKLYRDVNSAHDRGQLDAGKARTAVAALCRWFVQWADALAL